MDALLMLGAVAVVGYSFVRAAHLMARWAMAPEAVPHDEFVDPPRCPACGSYLTRWVGEHAGVQHLVLTLRCYEADCGYDEWEARADL